MAAATRREAHKTSVGDIPPTFDEDQVTECNCESITFGEGPEDLKVLFP